MHSLVPFNSAASDLLKTGLGGLERVLILGASGWFGRTALALLEGHPQEVLLVGGRERTIFVRGNFHRVDVWTDSILKNFRPQVVLDFAFLTKNHQQRLGDEQFAKANRGISERLVTIASHPSVEKLLTVSSGAAIGVVGSKGDVPSDLYGWQKALNEQSLRAVSERLGKEIVIARAWSVSGGFVREPQNYALSDFVLQGLRQAEILVEAPHLVYRRYVAVEDFLTVALAAAQGNILSGIDSGGEVVELLELAHIVADELGGVRVEEKFSHRRPAERGNYFADATGWNSALQFLSYTPLDLRSQVRNVISALSALEFPQIGEQ